MDKKDNSVEQELEPQEVVRDKNGIARVKGGKFAAGHGSANPGGRPQGPNFATVINRFLEEEDVDAIDTTGFTIKEKLVIDWIKKAFADDKAKVIEGIINRLEGTPVATQKVDLTARKDAFEAFNESYDGFKED